MSFQHFKLPSGPSPGASQPTVNALAHVVSPSSLSQALGHTHNPAQHPQLQQPPLAANQGGPSNATATQQRAQSGTKKGPYGSGDIDDGYTLVFESMEAFQAWRMKEEEEKMIEFVKGDTHGSKAVPPRFKDHTKLVCARHTRSGRKKYVKKYPDRVRKVPSRKLEGVGCPASISYKTYFDTDEIRACYISEHSHEIGLANLPFTRRGRKAAAEAAVRNKSRNRASDDESDSQEQTPQPPAETSPVVTVAGPSNPVAPNLNSQANGAPPPDMDPQIPPQPFQATIMAIPPVQPQQHHQMTVAQVPQTHQPPHAQAHAPLDLNQERWDRMSVLFQGIRDHARNFEYPASSVAALESVLIRLYLESPMGGGTMTGG